MKDQKKILLLGLPEALESALSEQLSGFLVMTQESADSPDLVVSAAGARQNFTGCPVLEIETRGGLRLGAIMGGIARRLSAPGLHLAPVQLGAWVFHAQARQMEDDKGGIIELTDREADMIAYLIRRGGGPVTRDDLLKDVWGYQEGVDTHTLETHIHRLRRKIGAGAIVTDVGGYKLCIGAAGVAG